MRRSVYAYGLQFDYRALPMLVAQLLSEKLGEPVEFVGKHLFVGTASNADRGSQEAIDAFENFCQTLESPDGYEIHRIPQDYRRESIYYPPREKQVDTTMVTIMSRAANRSEFAAGYDIMAVIGGDLDLAPGLMEQVLNGKTTVLFSMKEFCHRELRTGKDLWHHFWWLEDFRSRLYTVRKCNSDSNNEVDSLLISNDRKVVPIPSRESSRRDSEKVQLLRHHHV